ncbi:MAG: aspartate kinase [Candidatus Krumholzibacteriia bacterium]
MQLVVQKYGGTSVATTERLVEVARRIADTKEDGFRVVVVVSAMGVTTDELLELARQISPSPPARELDMLLTAGERISMALLSMALHERGHAAISFTGSQSGIITDTHHADARILEVRATRIEQALEAGHIVIVAGFQGVSRQREVTTLGRGGSDTTAVALAAVMGAVRCDICTDVDGVYSADPRLVPRARKLESLSYDETLELASHGARVLHPRSVEVARRFEVPLHVRSSFSPAKGTVIGPVERIETAVICGIASDEEVATLWLTCVPPRASASLLERLGEQGIPTRVVVQAPHSGGGCDLVCLLHRRDASRAREALEPLLASLDDVGLHEENDVAALTVVGQGIQSHPGTVGRILEALAEESVPLHLVSSSAASLTCVVPRADAARASRALHTRLGLDAPE